MSAPVATGLSPAVADSRLVIIQILVPVYTKTGFTTVYSSIPGKIKNRGQKLCVSSKLTITSNIMNLLWFLFSLSVLSKSLALPIEFMHPNIQLNSNKTTEDKQEVSSIINEIQVVHNLDTSNVNEIPNNPSVIEIPSTAVIMSECNLNGNSCKDVREKEEENLSTTDAAIPNTTIMFPEYTTIANTHHPSTIIITSVQISSVAIATLSGSGLGK
ncbi:hypothetical protein RN001_008624 [Aquatica leii]|uniref:Uncharacterized protein n=1 Tax=Aquatica leii TaxID=1421715 RepID=A0AAN7PAZ2_9COLE|nr:hypothetical protein RN001_008624 [Aquatica leii]